MELAHGQTDSIYAGIDVGGTFIKIGLVNEYGVLLASDKIPTQAERPPDIAFASIQVVIGRLLEQAQGDWDRLVGIGLATPGPLDLKTGRILTPFNLPGWRNCNVRQELSDLTGKPVEFANDAGAAAFGEFWQGSGRDFVSLILLTLGTGIGGGIIVDGMSIDGAHSHGSEVGHIIVDRSTNARCCSCGHSGHLEAYCSATALVNRCHEALEKGVPSRLREMVNSSAELTSLTICQAAEQEDPLAVELVLETAEILAVGITTLAHVIDPQVVLLGGAMNFGGNGSVVGERFLQAVREGVKQRALPTVAEQLKVDYACLGSDAGLIGAAGLAKQRFNPNPALVSSSI
jgi:glucokinase